MFIANQAGALHRIHKQREIHDISEQNRGRSLAKQEKRLLSKAESFDYGGETTKYKSAKRKDDFHQREQLPNSAPGSPAQIRKSKLASTPLSTVMSPRSMLKPSPTLSKRSNSNEKMKENRIKNVSSNAKKHFTLNLQSSLLTSLNCAIEKRDEKKASFLSVERNTFKRSSSLPEFSPVLRSTSCERLCPFQEHYYSDEMHQGAHKKAAKINETRKNDTASSGGNFLFSLQPYIEQGKIQVDEWADNLHDISASRDQIIPIHALTIFKSSKTRPKIDGKIIKNENKSKNSKGNFKRSACYAHGLGLHQAITKKQAKFYIERTDRKHASVSVTISGPRIVPPQITVKQIEMDMHEVEYWPNSIGMHEINIKCDGNHVEGSPFQVQVKSEESQIWFLA